MATIKKITTHETYSVRLPVLRKGKPIESCHFDGDDLKTTIHFGLYLTKELVGVVSLFKKNNPLFHKITNSKFEVWLFWKIIEKKILAKHSSFIAKKNAKIKT